MRLHTPFVHSFPWLCAFFVLSACGGRQISLAEHGSPGSTASPNLPPSQRPGPEDPDPQDVWLAFEVEGDNNSIFVMRADGSLLHEVQTGTASARAPAFSANGAAMAFAGPGGIYVLDLATRTSSQVTHGLDGVPAWSPDGKLIAFTRDVDIWIVGADGSGERPFVKGPPPGQEQYSNYGHPVFTKDGASIVFDRRGAIEIANVDGSDHRVLFAEAGQAADMVALSPDGTRAAFAPECGADFFGELRIVPLAQADQACTVGTGLGVHLDWTRPAWGANGRLAYTSAVSSFDLWTIPETGGTPTNLITDAVKAVTGGRYVWEIAWSPPGTIMP